MLCMILIVLAQGAELLDSIEKSSSAEWNYFQIETGSMRGNLRISLSLNSTTEVVLALSSDQPRFISDEASVIADYVDYNGWKLGYDTHWITVPESYVSANSNLTVGVGNPNGRFFTFQLFIESSDTLLCPNDCSGQGRCEDGKCRCADGFIGYDCRVQATEIETHKRYTYKMYSNFAAYCYFKITPDIESLSIYLSNEETEILISMDFSNYHPVEIPTNEVYFRQVHLTHHEREHTIKMSKDDFQGNLLYLAIFNGEIEGGVVSLLVYTEISLFKTRFILYMVILSSFIVLSMITFVVGIRYRIDNNQASNDQRAKGVPREVIEAQFPKIKYKNFENADFNKCIICLEDFKNCDYIRKLKCGHVFHAACIEEWLNAHICCCLCKQDCAENDTLAESMRTQRDMYSITYT